MPRLKLQSLPVILLFGARHPTMLSPSYALATSPLTEHNLRWSTTLYTVHRDTSWNRHDRSYGRKLLETTFTRKYRNNTSSVRASTKNLCRVPLNRLRVWNIQNALYVGVTSHVVCSVTTTFHAAVVEKYPEFPVRWSWVSMVASSLSSWDRSLINIV